MSLPEVLLWQRLRTRPHGVKFRRQHPIDCYVIDFYAVAAKLGIEIDGAGHLHGDRPRRDALRTAALARRGVNVVRVPASDVLADPDAIADALVAMALPLHRPAGGPPPHAPHGEDMRS